MKYKPTPFNILCAIVIVTSIFYAIAPGPVETKFIGLMFFVPFAFVVLLFDLFFQKVTKKYVWIFTIQIFVLSAFVLEHYVSRRTKTLVISEGKVDDYIVIIYGVEDFPALPINGFTWGYEVFIPDNGILMTSTNLDEDLPGTQLITKGGINIGSGSAGTYNLMCSDKNYKARVWKIEDSGIISTNSVELKALQKKLEVMFCKKN